MHQRGGEALLALLANIGMSRSVEKEQLIPPACTVSFESNRSGTDTGYAPIVNGPAEAEACCGRQILRIELG